MILNTPINPPNATILIRHPERATMNRKLMMKPGFLPRQMNESSEVERI